VNKSRAVPIKVANPNNIHSTSRRQVVKGRGLTTATAAIPQLKGKIESSKRVWKVLLDSGSDGDIAFIKSSEKASIDIMTDFIHKGGRPAMVFLRPLKCVTCY